MGACWANAQILTWAALFDFARHHIVAGAGSIPSTFGRIEMVFFARTQLLVFGSVSNLGQECSRFLGTEVLLLVKRFVDVDLIFLFRV
jgi:hypothetical protein